MRFLKTILAALALAFSTTAPAADDAALFSNPTAGTTYYIAVRAYTAYSGVNLKATKTP